MVSTLRNLRLLLLGSWVGAAIFFSAVVAPSAFSVLRAFNVNGATEVAGAIVSRTLAFINVSGFVLSLLLVACAFVAKKSYGKRAFVIQVVLLIVMGAATALGRWFIAAKMQGLRALAGSPIAELPASDPVRVAFDSLHGYSVAALSIAIIAALIAFFVIGSRANGLKPGEV